MDHEARFTRIESALEKLVEVQTLQGGNLETLVEVQTRMAENIEAIQTRFEKPAATMDRLAEAQAKSELAQAVTQSKLDALIHMFNNWIRERGHKNGGAPSE